MEKYSVTELSTDEMVDISGGLIMNKIAIKDYLPYLFALFVCQ